MEKHCKVCTKKWAAYPGYRLYVPAGANGYPWTELHTILGPIDHGKDVFLEPRSVSPEAAIVRPCVIEACLVPGVHSARFGTRFDSLAGPGMCAPRRCARALIYKGRQVRQTLKGPGWRIDRVVERDQDAVRSALKERLTKGRVRAISRLGRGDSSVDPMRLLWCGRSSIVA